MKRLYLLIWIFASVAVLAFGSAGVYFFRHDISDAWRQWQVSRIPYSELPAVLPVEDEDTEPVTEEPLQVVPPVIAPPVSDTMQSQVNLDVPMVYQAPFGVWDANHEDACEEASMLMVQAFFQKTGPLSTQEMDDRIMALIDYQMENRGYFESTTAEETAEIMRDYLGLVGATVIPVDSIDDIKRELAAGRPVILPADGKTLGNPNFRGDGPIYHMLVAKGYTETHIITHDPGTRRGANWLYTYETIMSSLADWVQSSHSVDHGRRLMIVVR